MNFRTFKVVAQKGHIPSTLNYEEKAYERELSLALNTMQVRSECKSLTLMPNFDFGWLLPPSVGYVAVFDPNADFCSEMFRLPKYNIFLKAKVKNISLTTEKHKDIEKALRIAFPGENGLLMGSKSSVSDGWSPCFSTKGASIGVYHSREKDIVNNDYIETSYIICHATLPKSLLNELQELEEALSNATLEYNAASDTKKPLNSEIRAYTYGEVFGESSTHQNVLNLAIENATRLVTIFASVLELELAQPQYETDNIYLPSKIDDTKFKSGVADAIKWWPKHLPIYPFTHLPTFEIENFNGELIPKHLMGFPLGAALESQKKQNLNTFDELCKKCELDYRSKISHFRPDLVTEYNTHRVTSAGVIYFCGCSPCRGPKGVLVYEGLDLGFKHVNHSPYNTTQIDWYNDHYNSYPVIFPFVEDQEAKKKPKPDSILRSFTTTQGGHTPITKLYTPEHFSGLFVNQHQLTSPDVIVELGTTALPVEELIPVKVFLSPSPFNISRF